MLFNDDDEFELKILGAVKSMLYSKDLTYKLWSTIVVSPTMYARITNLTKSMAETLARHNPEIDLSPILIGERPPTPNPSAVFNLHKNDRTRISTKFVITRNQHIKSNSKRIITAPTSSTLLRLTTRQIHKLSLSHAILAEKKSSRKKHCNEHRTIVSSIEIPTSTFSKSTKPTLSTRKASTGPT